MTSHPSTTEPDEVIAPARGIIHQIVMNETQVAAGRSLARVLGARERKGGPTGWTALVRGIFNGDVEVRAVDRPTGEGWVRYSKRRREVVPSGRDGKD